MKKLMLGLAMIVSTATIAQAKTAPMIIVSNNQVITVVTKTTKIPVNVLFAKDICYAGTPADAEFIIRKTISNTRVPFELTKIDTFTKARGDVIVKAEIEHENFGVLKLDIQPCQN